MFKKSEGKIILNKKLDGKIRLLKTFDGKIKLQKKSNGIRNLNQYIRLLKRQEENPKAINQMEGPGSFMSCVENFIFLKSQMDALRLFKIQIETYLERKE